MGFLNNKEVGERIIVLQSDLGLNSSQFAIKAELDVSFLSKIEKGARPLSKLYLQKIKKTFGVEEEWLLFGRGEKFGTNSPIGKSHIIRNPLIKTVRNHGEEPVRYYDADFSAGSNSVVFFEDNVEKPAYEMKIPAFSGCIAFNVFGDSMESLIKGGSVVFGRKLNEWKSYLEFGQIYGVVMKDERRFLKYIRKSQEDPRNCFLLRSENQQYDDFEIPKDKIHNIWLIEGWMLKRT